MEVKRYDKEDVIVTLSLKEAGLLADAIGIMDQDYRNEVIDALYAEITRVENEAKEEEKYGY